MESQSLGHNHSVQHSREAMGYSPTPRASACVTPARQTPRRKEKEKTSMCRAEKPVLSAYCVTATQWGAERFLHLRLLTSYKASEHRHHGADQACDTASAQLEPSTFEAFSFQLLHQQQKKNQSEDSH